MSSAVRTASPVVATYSPSSASRGAKARLWTRKSSRPNLSRTAANAASISSGFDTSHWTSGESVPEVSPSTFSRRRSFWYEKASRAPASMQACAVAQAMERLLATPKMSPFLFSRSMLHALTV